MEIHPMEASRWDDLKALFGTRGGAAHCWCQYFAKADWDFQDIEGNRDALYEQVTGSGPTPGLLAYVDDEPVGWVALGPRAAYPRLWRTPRVTEHHGDSEGRESLRTEEEIWAITCFVIRVGYRRRGIATRLLQAAIAYASDHGATLLYAKPFDTRAEKKPGSELYTGVLSSFLKAGFIEAERTKRRTVLVEKEI